MSLMYALLSIPYMVGFYAFVFFRYIDVGPRKRVSFDYIMLRDDLVLWVPRVFMMYHVVCWCAAQM